MHTPHVIKTSPQAKHNSAFCILHYAFPVLLVLLCLNVASLSAQTNKKIQNLQKEQKALKKNIASQEQLLRTTKKDVRSQLANLQVINVQIADSRKYVDGIHTELTALGTTIAQLETQLAALEADLADCKRKYRHAVMYMFRNRAGISKWQFILSAPDFRQMYRRMRYITEFSKYQRAQGAIIQKKEDEVNARRAELLGVKTEKDRLYREGQEETRKLQDKEKEHRQVVDELNKKQKDLQKTIAQQRKKSAALDARIDQLIQQEIAAAERRRKAEAERRRKAEQARLAKERAAKERAERERQARERTAAGKKTTSSAKNNNSKSNKKSTTKTAEKESDTATPRFAEETSADRALSGSFAANKGRLPMPVTGAYSITTRYGQYNVAGLSGVQLDSKGINITARPGAQARAVFKGEVTAIFTYGGMYNIIVRHGSYMSVYCNLSSTSVRRGQSVAARQALGTIAPDASGNCTLHFQLRKETARLNPEAWLAR